MSHSCLASTTNAHERLIPYTDRPCMDLAYSGIDTWTYGRHHSIHLGDAHLKGKRCAWHNLLHNLHHVCAVDLQAAVLRSSLICVQRCPSLIMSNSTHI